MWLIGIFLILIVYSIEQTQSRLNRRDLEKLFFEVDNEIIAKRQKEADGMNFMQPFMSPFNWAMMHGLNHFSDASLMDNRFAQTSIEVTRRVQQIEPQARQLRAPNMFCPFQQPVRCDPKETYRRFDGSCNNLEVPWWGQSDTPYKRWLNPAYSDPERLNDPRKSIDGSELPSPRAVSCRLHTDEPLETEPKLSHMVMQFGQFINHDVSLLAISKGLNGEDIDCSACQTDSNCFPIMMDSSSSYCSSRVHSRCMEFIRSSAAFGDVECSLGQREQHNIQTHFIDASHIYGNNFAEAEKLRDRSSGKGLMKVTSRNSRFIPKHHQKRDLLPKLNDTSSCLDVKSLDKACFMSGDGRSNQNPSLMSIHTLFIREHNRIARILSKLNPQWSDETVFQETRRIIIAEIQHITYNEWLPIIVGPALIDFYELKPGFGSYFNGYNARIDPRTANEWAAAAQRFGHSMVRSRYLRADSNFTDTSSLYLRSMYFRPHAIYDEQEGGLESIVRGLIKDSVNKVDRFVSSDLTKHLFEQYDDNGRPHYFDLMAINIQRGRDHGIPGYPQWRLWVNLPPVRTWEEMKQYVDNSAVENFKLLYKFVDDVDLISAGLAEFKEQGALVGPTFARMIALMYHEWKFGDRFWYETSNEPAKFTPSQLIELSKVTLAKVLCNNMDDTPLMQPNVFLTTKVQGNDLMNCSDMNDIDLRLWKA